MGRELMIASQLNLTAPDPPTTPGVPAYLILVYGFLLVIPIFVLHSRRADRRRANFGCLGFVVTLMVLWAGSAVLAYPYAVLVFLGDPELSRHREVWAVSAASPLLALGIVWWFRRDNRPLRRRKLLWRAGALLAACIGTLSVAQVAGLPLWSMLGVADGLSLTTIVVCIATWQLLDRLRPRQLMLRAWVPLAACVVVVALARSNGVPVMASPRTASHSALLVTLLLTALLAFAAALLCIGAWRLYLPDGRPARGEIWMADFPFEERPGSKDRPVVVVRVHLFRAEVLKSTSQDQSHREEYIRLPTDGWDWKATHDSWLQLKLTRLPLKGFRRYRGRCPEGVWLKVKTRDLPYVSAPADSSR